MKNDPIIHAPLSKIVEAIVPIIKEQLLKQMHPMVHQNEYPSKAVPLAVIVDMMPLVRQPLTEALASLGEKEEHPSEREVLMDYLMYDNRVDKQGEPDKSTIIRMIASNIDRYLAEKQSKKT